jgi:hypothetical protein
MKRFLFVVLLALILTSFLGFTAISNGEEKEMAPQEVKEEAAPEMAEQAAPALTIARMVVCESVENREPVGEAEVFPATTSKVYSYLEAKDIAEDTNVSFVWYFEENQVAKVDLTLRQGSRWRTYSSKNVATFKGDWKVELQDSNGKVLKAIAFRVE